MKIRLRNSQKNLKYYVNHILDRTKHGTIIRVNGKRSHNAQKQGVVVTNSNTGNSAVVLDDYLLYKRISDF